MRRYEIEDHLIEWLIEHRSLSYRTANDVLRHLITFYEQRVEPDYDSSELRYWSD